jgi:hypothetical protein
MFSARAFIPRPLRRGIVSQEVESELLLYVEATHQASALNASAARIWALCDGARAVERIAVEADLSADVVMTAVRELANAGLLENGAELRSANVIRRRALIAVGLAATPVILMILAPKAAAAASGCVNGTCTLGQICCSTGNLCPSGPGGGTCPP